MAFFDIPKDEELSPEVRQMLEEREKQLARLIKKLREKDKALDQIAQELRRSTAANQQLKDEIDRLRQQLKEASNQ